MRVDVSDVFSVHVGPESLIAKECVSYLRIGKEPHLCLVPSLATTTQKPCCHRCLYCSASTSDECQIVRSCIKSPQASPMGR